MCVVCIKKTCCVCYALALPIIIINIVHSARMYFYASVQFQFLLYFLLFIVFTKSLIERRKLFTIVILFYVYVREETTHKIYKKKHFFLFISHSTRNTFQLDLLYGIWS